jgi:hypothetical protein
MTVCIDDSGLPMIQAYDIMLFEWTIGRRVQFGIGSHADGCDPDDPHIQSYTCEYVVISETYVDSVNTMENHVIAHCHKEKMSPLSWPT